MKTDLQPGHILIGLAILFTIATMMIAGCTDSMDGHQNQTITTQYPQGGHTTPTVAAGTPSAQVPRNTVLQTLPSTPSATVVPSAASDPSERAVPNGILIDSIRDVTQGDPLVVSGRTSLPIGTDLIVKVVPVTMDKGTIAGDFGNLEKSAVTKVTGGSTNGNRFSVTFETGDLPAADHIVFVSDKDENPANSSSKPVGITSSSVFNIIAR